MGAASGENADPKSERIRQLLKWAILAAVLTLLVIVAVAIPMALKSVPRSTSSSKLNVDNPRPNNSEDPRVPSSSPIESRTTPPSLSPTFTVQPTHETPSLRPSSSPSATEPTQHPTRFPSAEPTTMAPTYTPIDPNYAFKMRLFWQKGYYWQETWDEIWHCAECTKCEGYGRKNGRDYGCEQRGNGESTNCGEGDMFWVHQCKERGSEFNIVDNGDQGIQVRLANTNLCMGRGAIDMETGNFGKRLMKAVICNKNDKSQQWAPIKSITKFELRPLEDEGEPEEEAQCVSQLHHPKDEEILSLHECKLCRIYETRYWEEYKE
eukprot:scaffold2214_cov139-Cylindrotheca_fusiformis.AAC.35